MNAGFASDPSKVGRSFVKFSLPSLPSGEGVWAASTYVYWMRNAAGGTANIGLHEAGASWSQGAVKWSTAPTIGTLLSVFGTSYDGTTPSNTPPAWFGASTRVPVENAMVGTGIFSVALKCMNEASGGWAYFAKKEYDTALGPRVLVAYGTPVNIYSVTLSPSTIGTTDISTGTVTLTVAAPMGGQYVTLGSSDGGVATVPSGVTVPYGQTYTTFTATAVDVGTATITATIGNDIDGALLTVE